jgi:hypothetical protein
LRFGVTAAAAVLGLSVAHPVAAVVVSGQGMAGIMLRMTGSQVRTKLGEPTRITRTRGALGNLVTRLLGEYEEVRSVATRFFVAPGHQASEGVVSLLYELDGYVVLERRVVPER